MVYVAPTNVYPYEAFPAEAEFSRCDRPLAITVAVGALRCAAMPTEDGTLPNELDQAEVSLAVLADMGAIYEAVTCCGFTDLAVTDWQAFPETGGCVGGRWEFQIGL